MLNPTAALLVRKSTKQAWSSAATVAMLDSFERLEAMSEGMNEHAGFAKFKATAIEGTDEDARAAKAIQSTEDVEATAYPVEEV